MPSYGLATIAAPTILAALDKIIFKKDLADGLEIANKSFDWKVYGLTENIYQTVLELIFLPYKAYITTIAIAKTIYRMTVSKCKLLEWQTAEQAEKQAIKTTLEYYKQMICNPITGIAIIGLGLWGSILHQIMCLLLGMLWIIGPWIACNISKPAKNKENLEKLSEKEKKHLLQIAQRTWNYFSDFMNEENNFLPPDNFEEMRNKKIANRTSPTNIGLGFISIISAVDLGFIRKEEGLELIQKSVNTVDKLTRWNGHLYNWYNTQNLQPLNPKYISSVDSGNFICYLFVLKQFLMETKEDELKAKAEMIINIINKWIQTADFSKLYNYKKRLFSIGYNIEEGKLTDSYYDLLASEARQTSLIAIAKKDVPLKHWNSLSRTLTIFKGYKGLVSWAGTSFEYLMANIIIRKYPGSLLQESCKFMTLCQMEYCKELGIPWGISESAFFLRDLYGNYQYKAFGIPWLGLKRGLAAERVSSSYGSILAISDYPREVMDNINFLEREKMLGKYGLYESIDYTPSRLKFENKYEVVKTYMAHHQGLILASLNNLFNKNILVDRFMKNPEIEAIDILLQEKMPKIAILTKEKKEVVEKIHMEDYATYSKREYTKRNGYIDRTNVIGSDGYYIYMDENGKGYSKYKDLLINKFKEDSDQEQGIFFYIKNVKTKRIWTSGILKKSEKPDKYKITFTPDSNTITRTDGNIDTKLKITVAPDEPIEIRKLELKNTATTEEVLEISSVIEPVLSNCNDEYAHPAFNDMFLTYKWDEKTEGMIVKRRSKNQQDDVYMEACMYTANEQRGVIEFENSKADFIGRNNLLLPEKIVNSKPLSNKVELTTEGLAAMRKTIKIEPNETACITLIIGVGKNKETVCNMISKYKNNEEIEKAFELSKAKTEAENRYLEVQAKDTDLYQKIIGYLLFQNSLMSRQKRNLPSKVYPVDNIWSLGISGDLPILLLKIEDPNDSYIIGEILKAKEFFMLKNCKVDIVILNEDKNVYEQYVKEKIENAIFEKHLEYLVGKKNGIYIINNNNIEQNQREALIFRSRLIFDAGKGKLKEQIEELEENYIAQMPCTKYEKKPDIVSDDKSRINISNENLEYYNGIGGFNKENNEYVFKVSSECQIPTVWSHILANKNFGTVITENLGGYTWYKNSRLNKLSAWNNIPYLDIPSEILYFKDTNTGKVWANSSFISSKDGDFKVKYGFGYATYINLCNDFYCETNVFVPKEDSIKVLLIKMKNTKPEKRKIKYVYYVKPVLGEDEIKTSGYLDLRQVNENSLQIRNLSDNAFKGIAFVGTSQKIMSYTGSKDSFIKNGSILLPGGINEVKLDFDNSLGKRPCIAFEFELEFEQYESKEFSIFIGETESKEESCNLSIKYADLQNCKIEFGEVKNYWFEKLNRVQVKTIDNSMNIMLNGWLLYQTICCRLLARSGYYQSSGAYGFRDQLQDTLALKYTDISYMKEQIKKACMHQFEEGDVEHWWHEETNCGIRTRFSDDLLWLPYVVSEYINITSDYDILDEQAEFICGEKLKEGTDECYDKYKKTNYSKSIYCHCIRAINKSISIGEHGLPKIGSGDWNDGLNSIGKKGKGESVWLGFFLYDILSRFIPICEKVGENQIAHYYETIAEALKKSLNTKGWDGRWFRRAYTDDGQVLGSNDNDECKIDSISQSWAVIANAGDNDKKYIAMESLENNLVDLNNGIIKLLTPPFENSNINPGYIKSYIPGVRENGGQYTHASAWVICAFAKLRTKPKSCKIL